MEGRIYVNDDSKKHFALENEDMKMILWYFDTLPLLSV